MPWVSWWNKEGREGVLRDRYCVEGPQVLSEVLGTTEYAIKTKVRRLGLRYKNRYVDQVRRNANCDIYFFEQSWSPDLAYVLGYIWADGGIKATGSKVNTLNLECKEGDRDILLEVRRLLSSSHKVSFYKGMIRCAISNHLMIKPLMEIHGILPRKSYLNLDFPSNVPDQFLGHFCRGYLDGDGSVCPEKRTNKGVVKLNGTQRFISGMQLRMIDLLEIPKNKIMESTPGVFRIEWGAWKDFITLYKFFYPEGNYPFGKRKRSLYERILGGQENS